MRSTADSILEHTSGKEVVRKRKRVVRKTEVVRRKKVARTVAARRARATTTGRAPIRIFLEIPRVEDIAKSRKLNSLKEVILTWLLLLIRCVIPSIYADLR